MKIPNYYIITSILVLIMTNFSFAQSQNTQYPYLDVCQLKTLQECQDCTEKRLHQYFSSQLKYPKTAQENKIEGEVLISFIINQDGKLINPIITKDFGHGSKEEVYRILEHLKAIDIKWVAGKEDGREVSFVIKNYPIYFDLEDKKRTPPVLRIALNPQKIISSITFKKKKKPVQEEEKVKIVERIPEKKKETEVIPPDDLRIYTKVDKNPIFPGCKYGGVYKDTARADDCSAFYLQQFIEMNSLIEYPDLAYATGVEGVVTISYIVEKDGTMSNIICMNDIGAGCGRAVVWAFERMKFQNFKWYPAEAKGKNVRVNRLYQYNFNLTLEKARRRQ